MTAISPVCPRFEQHIVTAGLLCSGHDDSISMGCLDGAGRRLLTVAFDKTARVWDIRTGRSLAVLQHQQQLVRGCMAPHGQTVVTVTADHVTHLWDVCSGQVLHAFEVRNPLTTATLSCIIGDSVPMPIMYRQMHASLKNVTFHWNSSVMRLSVNLLMFSQYAVPAIACHGTAITRTYKYVCSLGSSLVLPKHAQNMFGCAGTQGGGHPCHIFS